MKKTESYRVMVGQTERLALAKTIYSLIIIKMINKQTGILSLFHFSFKIIILLLRYL